jgi:hypothetical protein
MVSTFFSSLAAFDPVALMQAAVIAGASILLFLLLFTLRDIILRTHSFWFQALCVLLVGALPVVGFLLYLLIRPPRTIKERELYAMFESLTARTEEEPLHEEKELETEEIDDTLDEDVSSEPSASTTPTLSL